jgi:5-hydroxyisourate hydrolase-like protein (transthyretin family)
MNQNDKINSSDAQDGSVPSPKSFKPRNPILRLAVGVILLFVLSVGAYSVYLAVHEPDPQETVVLGQTKIAAGSPAALRTVVRNRVSGKPVQGAEVKLSLRNNARTVDLGSFRTDAAGSLGEAIDIPDIPPGEYEMILETKSRLGRDRVLKKLEVQHTARVLLSCDKPIYQPGQTIHLRSLLLNGRTQKPFTGEAVTFEVKDPKGNKVFKECRKSSDFGIASANFVLASELNLGRYEIRATAAAVTAERTVEVKRYVLPKFKILLAADQPYYLAGQTVSGSVQAEYFFGQAVRGGSVNLTASTIAEKPLAVTELQGQTDSAGRYAFRFALPDFLAGMPQKDEHAFLDLKAEVRDSAGHLEEKALSLSVARNELELVAIPEAGSLVPGVENLLYVLTSYPDGRPAPCRVFVNGTACQSDPQGVSEIKLSPADIDRQIEIQAIDSSSRKAKTAYRSDPNTASPAFLLRTDKAVYRAGQSARVTLLSLEKVNTVFIDVIKDGQTVLTRSVAVSDQKAAYNLALPAPLVGTLTLNAYVITEAGEDRGCSRVIYVNPASSLRVATSLSKAVYRPGEVARMDFAVTDSSGRPAPAALGIAAVDEAVFALNENRPGLLQQFLDVEGEFLKQRYQIKSFECPGQFLSESEGNQALAKAYLASLERRPAPPPRIDSFVTAGYIPRQLIGHIRELRGTPAYARYRANPEYAELLSMLEGESRIYSLRENTGPIKSWSIEAH